MTDLVEVLARAISGRIYGDERIEHALPHTQEKMRQCARSALTALESAGYRVVPVEPTPEMKWAMFEQGDISINGYRCALAAAPKVTL